MDGFDTSYGLTTTNMMEASLNKMMIKAAQKIIVLADSSKFGLRGFSKICDISEVDQIITDDQVPQHFIDELNDLGIEVTIV